MNVIADSIALDLAESERHAARLAQQYQNLRAFMSGACPEALAAFDGLACNETPPDPVLAERRRIADLLDVHAGDVLAAYGPSYTKDVQHKLLKRYAALVRSGKLA